MPPELFHKLHLSAPPTLGVGCLPLLVLTCVPWGRPWLVLTRRGQVGILGPVPCGKVASVGPWLRTLSCVATSLPFSSHGKIAGEQRSSLKR